MQSITMNYPNHTPAALLEEIQADSPAFYRDTHREGIHRREPNRIEYLREAAEALVEDLRELETRLARKVA